MIKNLIIVCGFVLFVCSGVVGAQPRISDQTIIPLLEMGRLEFEVSNYEWALEYYLTALKKDSSNPRVHFGLASTYYALKKYELALEHYLDSLELNPALVESYYGASIVYSITDQPKLALEYYRKALGLDSANQKQMQEVQSYSYNKVTLDDTMKELSL